MKPITSTRAIKLFEQHRQNNSNRLNCRKTARRSSSVGYLLK